MNGDLWKSSELFDLVKALLSLKNDEEARLFLRDLLTEKELREFSMRWKVAQMLDDGVPYTQIESETGLSSTTIARISKWLTTGSGGYQMMLDRFRRR
ncbi:MAG: DNA-binding transcriptional regulator [Bdellovibrionales bacterium]|nr:DNA-binding transcriptional regulator [Bdellovibrionales bacterium]